MFIAISLLVSYLIGAINFSFLYGKLVRGIDIREHGSGNAGATNTLRVLGKGPGIMVLVLDVLKGVAAVAVGDWAASPQQGWVPVACGLLAIVGHNWPVYFGFRGGKGVATTIGAMAMLAFVPTLIACAIAVAAIAISRFVSLGSLLIVLALPVLLLIMHRPPEIFWASVVLCLFVFIRHRSNIVKLWNGKENKLGAKKRQSS
ncbi:hypothetical protein SD70_06585 [Gordoniibacillus kamchatkensis]|uniref:Glycerol-3-phosphate acyltransferase n=1 Tax=Gordoniibacillus kamchatkensis TaxID=1590651 RepID=A0ABR5AKH7_9BACL|nr:glycerol-3-phosphate 1-O-acyltransferase PlsY [Paenibacillus sp. VKM B-2647]KIL41531.1 hypothetical protein SD70_06585 [Paenibacillus sp. VKM B-2647]